MTNLGRPDMLRPSHGQAGKLMVPTTHERLLKAQALVSRTRRGAKVAASRQGLVSNAEVLFSLADAIDRGEAEFWGKPITEGLRNMAVAIAESAANGLGEA